MKAYLALMIAISSTASVLADQLPTGGDGSVTFHLQNREGLVSVPSEGDYTSKLQLSETPLPNLKSQPAYRSKRPLYGELTFFGRDNRIAVVLDEAEGETPKIYVDRNNDRDLTNDGPGDWGKVYSNSPHLDAELSSIAIDVHYDHGSAPYMVRFFRKGYDLRYLANCHREGEIELDGRKYRAAVQELGGLGEFHLNTSVLVIDLNQDGVLDGDADSGERFKLSEPLNVRGKTWQVAAISDDGLTITFRPSTTSVAAKPYGPFSPGNTAPDFSTTGLDGKPLNLKQEAAQAKLVLLHHWISWDDYAREHYSILQKLNAQYKPYGLKIIGVNVDYDREAANEWVERFGLSYRHAFEGRALRL